MKITRMNTLENKAGGKTSLSLTFKHPMKLLSKDFALLMEQTVCSSLPRRERKRWKVL